MLARPIAARLLALLACGTLLWPAYGGAGSHGGEDNARHPPQAVPGYATGEFDRVRRLQQQGDILPLRAILERARRHRHGRVLDTQLGFAHDRYIYAVQLVDDNGQVWEVRLDAGSGELLEDQQEE